MSASALRALTVSLQSLAPFLLLATVVLLGIFLYQFRSPNRKFHLRRFGVALALLGACALALSWAVPTEYVASQEEGRAEDYAKSSFVHVGDAVPSFVVLDTDGVEFSPDTHRGKVLLINFFATWCGPCKLELPHLQKLDGEFHTEANYASIIIGRGETMETVRAYRSENEIAMRMAADTDESVFAKFASESIPRTIVVSPEGTIVYSKAGFYPRDIEVIRRAIASQL